MTKLNLTSIIQSISLDGFINIGQDKLPLALKDSLIYEGRHEQTQYYNKDDYYVAKWGNSDIYVIVKESNPNFVFNLSSFSSSGRLTIDDERKNGCNIQIKDDENNTYRIELPDKYGVVRESTPEHVFYYDSEGNFVSYHHFEGGRLHAQDGSSREFKPEFLKLVSKEIIPIKLETNNIIDIYAAVETFFSQFKK